MAFFKRQKEVSKNDNALKPSREPRHTCIASIRINGFEGEALITNISSSGYCMESRTYAALAPGERHVMRLEPEALSNLRAFDMEVEVRWVKSSETRFSAGFQIIKRPTDRSFEKYIDYVRDLS
ncbi:MAG: PilZ domain-containing protein [Treponema sp.]|jgi:hypothetical protein|nr:PilZ domain-containing protein [Treponema sp.]